MKKVYICAPLGGNVAENIERAKRYSEYALRCGAAPVEPHPVKKTVKKLKESLQVGSAVAN